MSKNTSNLIAQMIIGGVVAVVVFFAVTFYAGAQIKKARFAVDALQQYLQSYNLVEQKAIERLSDLPDFYLVSPSASLSLKSSDLKQGVNNGYVYDLQYLGKDKFVISASPAGTFAFYEFGITDKGILRMNNKSVDVNADSYEEVEQWPTITREERIRSKDLPAYLK